MWCVRATLVFRVWKNPQEKLPRHDWMNSTSKEEKPEQERLQPCRCFGFMWLFTSIENDGPLLSLLMRSSRRENHVRSLGTHSSVMMLLPENENFVIRQRSWLQEANLTQCFSRIAISFDQQRCSFGHLLSHAWFIFTYFRGTTGSMPQKKYAHSSTCLHSLHHFPMFRPCTFYVVHFEVAARSLCLGALVKQATELCQRL